MNEKRPRAGVVYSATTVHAADAIYQIALVDAADGGRKLVRVEGPQVRIGERVRRDDGSETFRREES